MQLPPANFNALFLLRHAASHFAATEIGMRHVADWAMFIEHSHNGIDWEALYVLARRMNMHRFLNCLNAIAIDRLGVDAGMIPAFDRDPALEERVLADILQPEFRRHRPREGCCAPSGSARAAGGATAGSTASSTARGCSGPSSCRCAAT